MENTKIKYYICGENRLINQNNTKPYEKDATSIGNACNVISWLSANDQAIASNSKS
jgi:hypothetical protein